MLNTILDLLFPRVSPGGTPGTWLTTEEFQSLLRVPVHLRASALRERGIVHLDSLTAVCTYDESLVIQAVLRRFKYNGVRSLAIPLGSLLVSASCVIPATSAPVLCAVPLHWRRRFMRGFNQSGLLAVEVARTTGWPVEECVQRVRATGQQAKRTRSERLHAMKNAFGVTQKHLPAHVVLVDDVATTCSTLDACAEALKRAGVERVDALVVALG